MVSKGKVMKNKTQFELEHHGEIYNVKKRSKKLNYDSKPTFKEKGHLDISFSRLEA